MTSHPSPSRKEPCAPVNWLDLPVDVSASIIRRLDLVDILTRVQFVCSMWRRICRDPSMWRSISFKYNGVYSNLHTKLIQFAVDLSSGGLLDVNLDCYDTDVLLPYITDRSKHLRRIRVGYWPFPSEVEFMDIDENLPVLEELDVLGVSCLDFSSIAVATVGRLCPMLHSLKINLSANSEAYAIAENMPGLRHLYIHSFGLSNLGLIAILNGCQHLESLDLTNCYNIKMDEGLRKRCERIQVFYSPDEVTMIESMDSDAELLSDGFD